MGPRAALATEDNADALCQWTAPQGYWACGWSNQFDWAWLNNTGLHLDVMVKRLFC
jgi:hypothetical protein